MQSNQNNENLSDCFHCRLAGPGNLCSYCRMKKLEGEQKAQQSFTWKQNQPAVESLPATDAIKAGVDNAQSCHHAESDTFSSSTKPALPESECFHCRLAGPGNLCSFCRLKKEAEERGEPASPPEAATPEARKNLQAALAGHAARTETAKTPQAPELKQSSTTGQADRSAVAADAAKDEGPALAMRMPEGPALAMRMPEAPATFFGDPTRPAQMRLDELAPMPVTQMTGTTPAGSATVQPQPVQPQSVQPKPVQPQPVQPKPVQPQPVQPKPLQPQPVQPKTVQPQPVQPKPVQPQPVQPQPVQPQTVQPKPVQPQPVQSQPIQSPPVRPQTVQPQSVPPPPVQKPVSPEEWVKNPAHAADYKAGASRTDETIAEGGWQEAKPPESDQFSWWLKKTDQQDYQAAEAQLTHFAAEVDERHPQPAEQKPAVRHVDDESKYCPNCAKRVARSAAFCQFCRFNFTVASAQSLLPEAHPSTGAGPQQPRTRIAELEIEDAEEAVRTAESRYGASDIAVADCLMTLAKVLRARGTRLAEANSLELRAASIREKYADKNSTQSCPYCFRTIKKQSTTCRYCDRDLSAAAYLKPLASSRSQPGLPTGPIRPHPGNVQEPIAIAMLSGCCITGLGQVIAGQVAKGFAIMVGSAFLGGITGGFSWWITWPLVAIDAYVIADRLKKGRTIQQWEWCWDKPSRESM